MLYIYVRYCYLLYDIFVALFSFRYLKWSENQINHKDKVNCTEQHRVDGPIKLSQVVNKQLNIEANNNKRYQPTDNVSPQRVFECFCHYLF